MVDLSQLFASISSLPVGRLSLLGLCTYLNFVSVCEAFNSAGSLFHASAVNPVKLHFCIDRCIVAAFQGGVPTRVDQFFKF